MRTYLDDACRFGYMRHGRACYCLQCNVFIQSADSRLFDNERKSGPFCEACARRTLHLPATGSDTAGNVPASPSLPPDLFERIDIALKQSEAVQGKQEALQKTIDNLSKRLKRIESFLKSQDLRQGYIWQAHVTKYDQDNP